MRLKWYDFSKQKVFGFFEIKNGILTKNHDFSKNVEVTNLL